MIKLPPDGVLTVAGSGSAVSGAREARPTPTSSLVIVGPSLRQIFSRRTATGAYSQKTPRSVKIMDFSAAETNTKSQSFLDSILEFSSTMIFPAKSCIARGPRAFSSTRS